MIAHPFRTLLLCVLVCIVAVPASSQQVAKRPITHDDYATWRSIGSPALSSDGSLVAYTIAPQVGDGEFVLRHLGNGKEFRHTRGTSPTPTLAARGKGGLTSPVVRPAFSPDG